MSSLSRGSTRPEGQSLASGSTSRPPGVHPPPTVWNLGHHLHSWQGKGEGDHPDGPKTLLFSSPHPHSTPEPSKEKENISGFKIVSKENCTELNTVTNKEEKEGRARKKLQEDNGMVRKLKKEIEARSKQVQVHLHHPDPYLQVPGPETVHDIVPVPREDSAVEFSSSSSSTSSSGGQSASSLSVGKDQGAKGALGQGEVLVEGGEIDIGTLYGGISCQTLAAYDCTVAVPPVLNLGPGKTTNLDFGTDLRYKARDAVAELPGEYRPSNLREGE